MSRLAYTALAFSLTLYGCLDGSQPDPDPVQEPVQDPDPVQDPVQDPEPVEDPVQDPIQNPAPLPDPVQDPVQDPPPPADEDPAPSPPAAALELSGLYHSVARWDLSSAITEHPGVGTVVEEGKRKIEVEGATYLLEMPLRADFALVQAFLCDYSGNLTYALTARNFNPVIAMAAATVIVDAEHIVPVGVIPPDHVVTPAVLVDYVVAHE
jgi:hypothetical protein